MDPDAVAKAFVEHYYRTFDGNRAALGGLYQDASMLTFEGDKIQGAAAIVAKLTSLPFQQCAHAISTVDCQPSGPAGGVLVFVSGSLQLAGESHTLKFSQLDSVLSNMRKSPKIAEKMIQASTKKSNCKKTKVGWGVPPSLFDSQD